MSLLRQRRCGPVDGVRVSIIGATINTGSHGQPQSVKGRHFVWILAHAFSYLAEKVLPTTSSQFTCDGLKAGLCSRASPSRRSAISGQRGHDIVSRLVLSKSG